MLKIYQIIDIWNNLNILKYLKSRYFMPNLYKPAFLCTFG
nr:MAG TPA: hypothetical protein [Caudoviricetes sp.]